MAIITSNEDISTEILLRLPVKSVLNLKTVSKLWLYIVSTPHFRHTHASRYRAVTGLFFDKDSREHDGLLGFLPLGKIQPKLMCHDIPADLYARGSRLSFTCESSCNGLLLLSHIGWRDPKYHMYSVYNPSTKEYRGIDIPAHIRRNPFVCASLAFDPSQLPYYKVVFLYPIYDRRLDRTKFQIEVYSSMTGTCKTIVTNSFIGDFKYYHNRGILCNAAIHWLSSKANSVVYFDVHTEFINELEVPSLMDTRIYYFGASRGHLHIVKSQDVHWYWMVDSYPLEVYELKRDYSGWFLKYQVDLAPIASEFYIGYEDGNLYQCCYALSIFQKEEEDDEATMVLLIGQDWAEYNLKMKKTKQLCQNVVRMKISPPFPFDIVFNNHQFIPTLACV